MRNIYAALLLSTAALPALAAEPATPGKLGEDQTGVFEQRGDVDRFTFKLAAGEYALGVLFGDEDYGLSAVVRSPAGKVVATTRSDSNVEAGEEFRAAKAGTYTVEVTDASSAGVTYPWDYQFVVTSDCGDDVRTSCQLKVGTTQQRRHTFALDDDWYEVQLTKGRTYLLSFEGGATPFELAFRDAKGKLVAGGGDYSSSALAFKPARTGTYFASLKGTQDAGDIYKVTLRQR